ncbi:hypothetical protein, partial [Paraburkholderia sp. SIMBA_053]|uniref:hypothetical protein n=1 Tax=Paraburkholderia sp. SIMBA_053 TaxID=3085794 RepID=UPI00397A1558
MKDRDNGVSKDLIIEAGLQLIPNVGGALATVIFGRKQEKRYSRLEGFYNQLASEVEGIKSSIR